MYKCVYVHLCAQVYLCIFVHDVINSVADYNSLRVGVGWMSGGCRMYVVPVQISRLDNF